MKGTSGIERNYVAPLQGLRLLGDFEPQGGARWKRAYPGLSMSRPVGASVRGTKLSCMSLHESHFFNAIHQYGERNKPSNHVIVNQLETKSDINCFF